MKHLLQKRFPVIFLLLLFNTLALATPDCPIVTGRFNGLPDGTTVNNSSTGWYIDAGNVASGGYFAVKSNRFHAQELGGVGTWYSKVFSTAGYSEFQVAVKVSSEGDMNSSEYVKIYYKINGGALTLLDERTGNFGTIDFKSPVLTGSNVQIVVKIYNYNNGGSQTSKYYIEEYRVFKEHGACAPGAITVNAAAGNGGVLTCSNTSITLSASSTGSGVSYSWTGPGGFTSSSQNPTVNTAGTYTVVGTNSTGSGSASVTVTENKTPPGVAATGGSLSCGSSVTLSATSPTGGVSYSWTGPGGFTSPAQNPTVNTAGTYTVTVTNPANGCTSSQSVQVTGGSATPVTLWNENFTKEDNTTSDNGSTAWTTTNSGSGTFAVISNEFRVNNVGASAEGTWTSQAINIAGKSNVTVNVDVRSGVATGGGLENSGSSLDYLRLYYKINGGAEVLFSEQLGTINNNSSTNTTVSVGSLAGSTLQVVIRGRTTAADEFYYFDNVVVSGVNGSATTITTSVSGSITCTSNAQLFAAPAGGSVSSYAWTGPNGFTSTQQNPVISAGGLYIVTGTLSGGCTTTASILVNENKTTPDILASGGSLVCLPSIVLNVNSSVAGAQYSWSGPGGFSSNMPNPSVSVAGTYTATVTNPANGCTASQAVQVTAGAAATNFWVEDFTAANGTTADNGATGWSLQNSAAGTFAVENNEFKISFNSANEGVWLSDVINIASKSNVVFSVDLKSSTASGDDYLEDDDYIQVYYKLNNGAEVLVYGDIAGLNGVNNGTSTHTVTSAALNGTTVQIIIRARNSHSTERYYFDNVIVNGAENVSVNATATANGVLSCATTSVTLSGSSSAPGATYNWSGPNGFVSTMQNPTAETPGIYTLTVSNSSGCTATDTALVSQTSLGAPEASITVPGASVITCVNTSVSLVGSSSTAGVEYSWTGPEGYSATTATIQVNAAGTYELTVTDPVNGCFSTTSTVVAANTVVPAEVNAAIGSPATLTCAVTSVTLNGSSATGGVNYAWSGPGGFTASTASTSVSAPGNYTLTVTDPANGCTASASASVAQNIAAPAGVTAAFTNELNCYFAATDLTGTSTTAGVDYSWTGPGGFTASTAVANTSVPGTYNLTVTNPTNGCVTNASTTVVQNITPPANVTAVNDGDITCTDNSVVITGSSATAGVDYFWTGPNDFISFSATETVMNAGTYTLTVTDLANGCFTTAETTVGTNTTAPAAVSASHTGDITCTNNAVPLTGSSATAGVLYSWTGPGGFTASTPNATANAAGTYVLTVTNPANGCTAAGSTTVAQNLTPPAGVTAAFTNELNCYFSATDITGTSTTPGVQFSWTGPGGFTANTAVANATEPGTYNLTVTNPANGCFTNASTTVVQNITPPENVLATNAGPVKCGIPTTITGSSTTPGADYFWIGPDDFISFSASETVSIPGDYFLTVTNLANGCIATASTFVDEECIGPVRTATTQPAAEATDAVKKEAGLVYKTYPNPFREQMVIEFASPEKGQANIGIYNSQGVLVKQLYNSAVKADELYKFRLSGNTFHAGMYYCIVRINGKMYTRKLLLIK